MNKRQIRNLERAARRQGIDLTSRRFRRHGVQLENSLTTPAGRDELAEKARSRRFREGLRNLGLID